MANILHNICSIYIDLTKMVNSYRMLRYFCIFPMIFLTPNVLGKSGSSSKNLVFSLVLKSNLDLKHIYRYTCQIKNQNASIFC